MIFLSSKPPYFTEPNSDPCPISPAVGFCCSFWQSDFGQPDIGGWSAVHVGEMADQQENEGLFIIHHWLRHGIIIKRYSTSVLWTYPKYLLILIPMKLWLGRGPWHVDQFAFQSDQQNWCSSSTRTWIHWESTGSSKKLGPRTSNPTRTSATENRIGWFHHSPSTLRWRNFFL